MTSQKSQHVTSPMRNGWNADEIARALAMQVFNRRALVMVPNCYWTGDECDLLVVRNDLRLVDVEVKISRSDLKADAGKGKWVDISGWGASRVEVRRTHPRKIWKHYYAMPTEVWKEGMEACIPATSGVLFIRRAGPDGRVNAYVHRQAKPCPTADKLTLEQVMDVARVCSVRYWDRYAKLGRVAV